jgi:hypothetical protein
VDHSNFGKMAKLLDSILNTICFPYLNSPYVSQVSLN